MVPIHLVQYSSMKEGMKEEGQEEKGCWRDKFTINGKTFIDFKPRNPSCFKRQYSQRVTWATLIYRKKWHIL